MKHIIDVIPAKAGIHVSPDIRAPEEHKRIWEREITGVFVFLFFRVLPWIPWPFRFFLLLFTSHFLLLYFPLLKEPTPHHHSEA
jgi:hypothetical protein